ncbi:MAG TPA: bifunctional glutamate N-acetyltransferase/amino-acid acetyltransferase ArgJ, partial [Roseiflexaceae bacterium]
ALYLQSLTDAEQPGIHTRRIDGSGRATDEALLAHYSKQIERLGGRADGHWEFAVCVATGRGQIFERTIVSPRTFVDKPSQQVIPGYPLESIQIEPESGMYISEMSPDEQDAFWQKTIGKELCAFIQEVQAQILPGSMAHVEKITMTSSLDTFTLAPGFRAAATACGLKPSGNLDLALIAADRPCVAAGVFTTNRVKAAPVLYDQKILEQNPNGIRAIIANAGCANACTGPRGMDDTRKMAALAAYGLRCQPDEVLVLSTGVIGRRLDMDKLTRGIADITAPGAQQGAPFAARAILTTDTRPKVAARRVAIGDVQFTISGFCKGAGMIHPNMATMLAIITTDAVIAPAPLQAALRAAVARSFNRVSVDGDMSTNDTVLLLASGASGVEITTENVERAENDNVYSSSSVISAAAAVIFTQALTELCVDLAKQIARDGEGATRLVEITVSGALDEAQAHVVADSIARSPLVKTAIHGGDPNWGRVLCAAGYSGAALDPDRLALAFGADGDQVRVVAHGLPAEYDERTAAATLRGDTVYVNLDLGLGDARATVWTCDLTAEYVAINAHYTT